MTNQAPTAPSQALAIIETTAAAVPLTKPEQQKLAQLEHQIEASKKKFFYDIGMALATINKEQLYRETHDTFEAYVEEKHEFKRDRAYKLIRGVEVAENLNRLASGYPMPTVEWQVRDLVDFAPEEQAAIWKKACDRAEIAPGGKAPPASIVKLIVDEWRASLDGADVGRKKSKAKKQAAAPEPDIETDEDDEDEPNVSDDFYTPEEYIQAVRDVLGTIELDPASCDEANEVVKAERIFTIEDDGLEQGWDCDTLYTNPPFSRGNVDRFVKRLLEAYDNGEVKEAILLVNSNTSSSWFQPLLQFPCCVVEGRIKFRKPKAVVEAELKKAEKTGEKPSQHGKSGCVFVYFGPRMWEFIERFREFGKIVTELRVA